jgi:hypothetical protein
MPKFFHASALVLLTGVAFSTQADPRADEARALVKEFASSLQGELKQAMQAGGAIQAIEVCHSRAPEIAADLSAREGWEVARTSLKRRNAGNAPDAWEQGVLEQFEARKEAGEPPAQIEHSEMVATGGETVFRYMKAIPTQQVCLACHGGDTVAPQVADKIAAYYPDDQARGYAEGDLRGAFSLTRRP